MTSPYEAVRQLLEFKHEWSESLQKNCEHVSNQMCLSILILPCRWHKLSNEEWQKLVGHSAKLYEFPCMALYSHRKIAVSVWTSPHKQSKVVPKQKEFIHEML